MTETNDYKKAKSECWRLLCDSCVIKGATRDCFNVIFERAYRLGKAHAQPANGLVNERLQVAAMAMQGALSNQSFLNNVCTGLTTAEEIYSQVASVCVSYADALLTELNNQENETNSEN